LTDLYPVTPAVAIPIIASWVVWRVWKTD